MWLGAIIASYPLFHEESISTIVNYVSSFSDMLAFFQGILPKPPFALDKNDAMYAKNLVRPVANDSASNLTISIGDHANITLNVTPEIGVLPDL